MVYHCIFCKILIKKPCKIVNAKIHLHVYDIINELTLKISSIIMFFCNTQIRTSVIISLKTPVN